MMSRKSETDDPTSHTIVPTVKTISDKRASVLRQIFRQMFVSTGANMNFQIVVALACYLIYKNEFDMHQFTHMLGHKVVAG